MFKKNLCHFSNKFCKADINIDRGGYMYVACKIKFLKIKIFTDCSIEDYKEPFWKGIDFARAFNSLCIPENVLFTTKRYLFFPRKVHTIVANKKADIELCKTYINY